MRRREGVAALLASAALLAASLAHAFELPDGRVTPGAVGSVDGAPPPSTSQVCVRGYARSVRHPYDSDWRRYRTAIFREYGIAHAEWSQFTIDHLVPLELGGRPFGIVGGAWDLRNVWPEPKAEAEQKDAVENAVHEAVCYRSGFRGLHLSLSDAQRAMERDWTHTPVGLPPVRQEILER